jgi:hypothetical protein
MWLFSFIRATRSSLSLMSFFISSLRLKFARSLIENFSLIIDAVNYRQLNIYKHGTLTQIYAFVKQAKSVSSAYIAPSSLA